jgi:hypothetical protein
MSISDIVIVTYLTGSQGLKSFIEVFLQTILLIVNYLCLASESEAIGASAKTLSTRELAFS